MDLNEVIRTRRSVRKYKEDSIPEQTIRELIEAATWAPSGMNAQPWVFAVVEDREYLRNLSHRAKKFLLGWIEAEGGPLEKYKQTLSLPDFDIFYNAPVLVLIYGDKHVYTHVCDCSMAAQNLMLAACARGIGSCWIGFARSIGNTPEAKDELNIPEHYELVAPVVLGYPEGPAREMQRKEAKILSWKK